MPTKLLLSFIIGLLAGGLAVSIVLSGHQDHSGHHDNHPIADPTDDEYHVHADFHIVVRDTLVDLDGDVFQTTSQQELHDHAHLHDNNGDVKHIHAEGVTFTEFLNSLGITLTDTCVTLDNEYCTDDNESLVLVVNNERFSDPYTSYIPVDDDRVLLYYGVDDPVIIQSYMDAVPADACFYSGTCPERGVAPPESCGLTCDL